MTVLVCIDNFNSNFNFPFGNTTKYMSFVKQVDIGISLHLLLYALVNERTFYIAKQIIALELFAKNKNVYNLYTLNT